MRFRYLATLSFAFAFVTLPAPSARAQTSQNSGWGDLSISAARIDYDLSGVGSAPGFSIRTTRDLSPNVALEFGGVFAKLEQPLGTTPLFMPEAHVRYRWNLGRFSPYMSGGMGASLVTSSFHSDWDPTLSIAGGTGVRLTERLAAVGELRIRGHQFNFAGSTADISGGLVWRLSAF
jgi:hypothetical protein